MSASAFEAVGFCLGVYLLVHSKLTVNRGFLTVPASLPRWLKTADAVGIAVVAYLSPSRVSAVLPGLRLSAGAGL